jgi:hypothetical protein
MRKLLLRSVAVPLLVASVGLVQPAHAFTGGSTLSGQADGTYSPPMTPAAGVRSVTLKGTFAGLSGTQATQSAGAVPCSLAGTTTSDSTLVQENGNGSGTCGGGLIVPATSPIGVNCTFSWARVALEEVLTLTCTFTIGSNTFVATGSGAFLWVPKDQGVSTFELIGTTAQQTP